MSDRPLISIFTPVYNQRLFIEQTIQSVLNQTYQDWEWIILDDGSTDSTGDVIRRYNDGRITYTYQEHAGAENIAKTCNKALNLCKGDLIALLDSDDYWPKYKLMVQAESFNDPEIVLSYGECCVVNRNGKKLHYMDLPRDVHIAYNNPVGSSLKIFLKQNNFLAVSTVMLKKDALLRIGGFIEADGLPQDFPTWTRLSLEGRFDAVSQRLGYWRRHLSSMELNADKELRIEAKADHLRGFINQHEKKLRELGFICDMAYFEKHWKDRKNELENSHHHYNRALLLLNLGGFKEAKTEFRMFLDEKPSIKHTLIYILVKLSDLIRIDIVNPLARLKEKVRRAE